MTKVFIDGSSGTTGLRIHDRLRDRSDLSLLSLPEAERKDPLARQAALKEADIAFLCLPDAAAVEAEELARGMDTVLIDTSTAHRVADGWAYGLPELPGQRRKIANSSRIANPGCHATGFIALVAPLVATGLIPRDACLAAFSLTGYSGGGKKMIADYEDPSRAESLRAPRMYALTQNHKHLPEMAKLCGLSVPPVFSPVVGSFYAGMEVVISLRKDQLRGGIEEIRQAYGQAYPGPVIRYRENTDESGFLSAGAYAGRDDLEVTVYGNEDRLTLVSRFDNLGKGASGAAIQNMNLVLGLDETTGLIIGGEKA